jgi:hypothetical protein
LPELPTREWLIQAHRGNPAILEIIRAARQAREEGRRREEEDERRGKQEEEERKKVERKEKKKHRKKTSEEGAGAAAAAEGEQLVAAMREKLTLEPAGQVQEEYSFICSLQEETRGAGTGGDGAGEGAGAEVDPERICWKCHSATGEGGSKLQKCAGCRKVSHPASLPCTRPPGPLLRQGMPGEGLGAAWRLLLPGHAEEGGEEGEGGPGGGRVTIWFVPFIFLFSM